MESKTFITQKTDDRTREERRKQQRQELKELAKLLKEPTDNEHFILLKFPRNEVKTQSDGAVLDGAVQMFAHQVNRFHLISLIQVLYYRLDPVSKMLTMTALNGPIEKM